MSAGGQSIQWQYLESQYFTDDFGAYNIDVLAILDCCYAAATRSRTDQVLAACGSNETRSRSGGITFSQRLAAAARALQGTSPKPFVTIDDIYDKLQQDKPPNAPAPRLKYLGGTGPIALPFKEKGVANLVADMQGMHISSAQQQHALVQLSVLGEPRETIEQFEKLIYLLPLVSRLLLSTHGNQDRSSLSCGCHGGRMLD